MMPAWPLLAYLCVVPATFILPIHTAATEKSPQNIQHTSPALISDQYGVYNNRGKNNPTSIIVPSRLSTTKKNEIPSLTTATQPFIKRTIPSTETNIKSPDKSITKPHTTWSPEINVNYNLRQVTNGLIPLTKNSEKRFIANATEPSLHEISNNTSSNFYDIFAVRKGFNASSTEYTLTQNQTLFTGDDFVFDFAGNETTELYMDFGLGFDEVSVTDVNGFLATVGPSAGDLGGLEGKGSANATVGGAVWPVKHSAVVEGDLVLGGLMMVHEREDSITCGPVMPQGGIQALEAMLYTLDRINEDPAILPNVTLGAHILDDCDKDTYGLEMAVDFIKGRIKQNYSVHISYVTTFVAL